MRKLIVSMNISLDGFMSGSRQELDWHFASWGSDMAEKLTRDLAQADTLLLGRNTYEAMASYWREVEIDTFFPRDDIAHAVMLNTCQKLVYSRTLTELSWNNSRQVKGDLRRVVATLKQPRPGQEKNILVYGSGQLVAALTALNLVDEYHLWVHPVVLGQGVPLFREGMEKVALDLFKMQTFRSGVVWFRYIVTKNALVPTD
ncbi:dihydrofolate reductase family protein [Chitinophaga qingshengii]|uniref:Dihydrofolate reductase n=1 Tax=Chitinophaga qingshengii TaxID=1569794 RepID=A0ABR7TVQ8_9BACT|nr:dihydrofolate reductase family protein [Chitinophaga qingshengii]MBC9934083.1 dihydrofolate reductase [Chitinophaga qingshengii]